MEKAFQVEIQLGIHNNGVKARTAIIYAPPCKYDHHDPCEGYKEPAPIVRMGPSSLISVEASASSAVTPEKAQM